MFALLYKEMDVWENNLFFNERNVNRVLQEDDGKYYILIDCIDNVNIDERIQVFQGSIMSNLTSRDISVETTKDELNNNSNHDTHAVTIYRKSRMFPSESFDNLSDVTIGSWLRYKLFHINTDEFDEFNEYAEFDAYAEFELKSRTVLVLPYGANTNLAGFRYIYDIDLLNALTSGSDFVIARMNSLIVYKGGELRILPYGFNWFAQQLYDRVRMYFIRFEMDYETFRKKLLNYIQELNHYVDNAEPSQTNELRDQFILWYVPRGTNAYIFDRDRSSAIHHASKILTGDVYDLNLRIAEYTGELDIDVKPNKITINDPVYSVYRYILRDTPYVLYGWLRPFKKLGISFYDFVNNAANADNSGKKLTDIVRELFKGEDESNNYEQNCLLLDEAYHYMFRTGNKIGYFPQYESNRELFIPLERINIWRQNRLFWNYSTNG